MASAAILAGGAGRRFGGRDKGALVFGGQTILERQLAVLSSLTADIMIVGIPVAQDFSPAIHRSPEGPRHIQGPRHIPDHKPGSGPLGGLQTALIEAHENPIVLIACDMPFVSTALVRHLLEGANDADAVVPRTNRGYHPLCAVYSRSCLETVERRLRDGRLAMVGLLDELRLRVVGPEEIGAFGNPDWLLANVNTESDYDRLSGQETHEP